jgi:hypothetical protein
VAGQKQHVELHRKLLLRRALLKDALPGAVYVPFCGDGDIAEALYWDRPIWAADLDEDRVAAFGRRIPDATVIAADCDSWPFAGESVPFAVADFDSYAYPYASFRTWWAEAQRTSRVVLFFTDGERQAITRAGTYRTPAGEKVGDLDLTGKRRLINAYLTGVVKPWFEQHVAPWQVLRYRSYLRGSMLYWGAIVQNPEAADLPKLGHDSGGGRAHKFNAKRQALYLAELAAGKRRGEAAEAVGVDRTTVYKHRLENPEFAVLESQAEVDACDEVEDALRQAALSGNVPAALAWLYNRSPDRWQDRRRTEFTGKDGDKIEVDVTYRHAVESKLLPELAPGGAKGEAEPPQ